MLGLKPTIHWHTKKERINVQANKKVELHPEQKSDICGTYIDRVAGSKGKMMG